MTLGKEFFTAGKAIFTVELPAEFAAAHKLPGHYTFRIKHAPARGEYRENWFVGLLTGPDNTFDYDTFGMLDATSGSVRLTRKSKLAETSMPVRLLRRILANAWGGTMDRIARAGFDVRHEGRCAKCGRTLTTPESLESGIGPVCAGRE